MSTATRPRGTFSADLCAELNLLGRGQYGKTIRIANGESRAFIGPKEARVGTGPTDGLLPTPILTIAEGPTGTLSKWAAEVSSSGRASVVAVRFDIPRIGTPRPGLLPGDLIPDREAFSAARARADAIAPVSALVTTDETLTALWSLGFPIPAAEAADLSKRIAEAVGGDSSETVPLHGFAGAVLEYVDGSGRVYTPEELAAKAAEKGEAR